MSDLDNIKAIEEKKAAKVFLSFFKPGMRVLKTVIASFICMMIDYFRGEIPVQTVITTAICMQPNPEQSLSLAISRMIGTIIGAVFGISLTFLVQILNIELHTLVYYLVICLFMIPLINIINKVQSPRGVVVSIVLFLSITLVRTAEGTSWIYIANRVLDTFIGILVALVINVTLPGKDAMPAKRMLDLSKVDALGMGESIEKSREKKATRLFAHQRELEEEHASLQAQEKAIELLLAHNKEMEAIRETELKEKEFLLRKIELKEKEIEKCRKSILKLEEIENMEK